MYYKNIAKIKIPNKTDNMEVDILEESKIVRLTFFNTDHRYISDAHIKYDEVKDEDFK